MECVRFIFHCLFLAQKEPTFWIPTLGISDGKKLFSVYICEVILKQLKEGKNIWQGRLVWWDKFGWSLNFRLQLFSSHYEANWKPLYFTNFWGIKSRIYDSCEISNCRDKNRFYGFLDTRTIQLLSSEPQKYFHEQKKPKWMQWRGRSLI